VLAGIQRTLNMIRVLGGWRGDGDGLDVVVAQQFQKRPRRDVESGGKFRRGVVAKIADGRKGAELGKVSYDISAPMAAAYSSYPRPGEK